MTITYPLPFPTTFGVFSMTLGLQHVVSVAESVFSLKQQVQAFEGTAWQVQLTINQLTRAEAEEYNSFLFKLNGRLGTFLLAIPGAEVPAGVATGTPLVDGAGQTGNDLLVKGFTPNITGIMKVGDYINLGTGSATRLHKVVEDADSDGTGNTTLVCVPKITKETVDGEAIVVTSAKGLFRLANNQAIVQVAAPNTYSMVIDAKEVK